jgi:NAD(P)-dependent dehydrogenase (short-subunit alcohol dehydrogenase family)
MACPETRLGKGWESQFAVNHVGHFVLAAELMPLLKAAQGARVVALSSTAHKRSDIRWDDIHFRATPYEKWVAYGQSKTANALFAVGLDAREEKNGVRAYAVHPGGILTPLQRHLRKEEMVALGWIDEAGEIPAAALPFFKRPDQGAATTLWCATSARLAGLGGVYCEDCDIADIAGPETARYRGVAPHAVDRQSAERLWRETERMLAA